MCVCSYYVPEHAGCWTLKIRQQRGRHQAVKNKSKYLWDKIWMSRKGLSWYIFFTKMKPQRGEEKLGPKHMKTERPEKERISLREKSLLRIRGKCKDERIGRGRNGSRFLFPSREPKDKMASYCSQAEENISPLPSFRQWIMFGRPEDTCPSSYVCGLLSNNQTGHLQLFDIDVQTIAGSWEEGPQWRLGFWSWGNFVPQQLVAFGLKSDIRTLYK